MALDRGRLEATCQQILNQNGYPTYTTLKRLMASMNSDSKQAPPPVPAPPNTKKPAASTDLDEHMDVYVRGADYYQEGW